MTRSPLTKNQLIKVVSVPLISGAIAILGYFWLGTSALIIAPVLIGIFLAYLIVESRHIQLGLFVRMQGESRAHFGQVDAIVCLQAINPKVPLPTTGGWAASPDLLRTIYMHVLLEKPNTVVEASSGTSTLVIAYALQKIGKGKVMALEHDPIYAERTRSNIEAHGLSEYASVILAPLVQQAVENEQKPWYDIAHAALPENIDLLLIDGPPKATGHLARYPAVPLLISRFSSDCSVFLDDGRREDERKAADLWSKRYNAHSCEYLYLEKGAWHLRFKR